MLQRASDTDFGVDFARALIAHDGLQQALDTQAADAAWRVAVRGQLQLLDQLQRGAIVLDCHGRVLLLNDTATRGVGVRVVDGALRAEIALESARVLACVEQASADRAEVPAVRRTLVHAARDGRPIMVECTGMQSTLPGVPAGYALILTARPLHAHGYTESLHVPLRQLFRLTPREATLCLLLAEGLPMAECAAAAGMTVGHARQRARRIYAKTATRGQAALAALVARM